MTLKIGTFWENYFSSDR